MAARRPEPAASSFTSILPGELGSAVLFRLYEEDECDKDGYPWTWRRLSRMNGEHYGLKDLVRFVAYSRCIRCGHPYRNGEHGNGEWSPCGDLCRHGAPIREHNGMVEAQWRILTVHHANGNKADCRWWNLLALCQRCHLTIQGRVDMERAFIFEHSEWFKPYAAGWYAHKYLGEDITRAEATARQDELLGLERLV